MTKQEFKELVAKGKVVLDGATGSNLMKAGMPRGVCSEAWIYENPQALIELQKAYAEAGSDIIYAPTFSANRISLANHGLEDKVEELNRGLVKITKDAVGDKCLVAGDVTTTGKQEIAYEELLEAYTEQIRILNDAGVDLLVAETMLGVTEVMAVLDAAAAVCDLPVMCTLTVESDGSLFFGGDIYEAVESLEQMGADAVGINCYNRTGPVSIGCGKHQKTSTDSGDCKTKCRVCRQLMKKEMRLFNGSRGICKKYESIDGCRCGYCRWMLWNDSGIIKAFKKRNLEKKK